MEKEDKDLLESCIDIRRNLIAHLTNGGMPKDSEDQKVLLATLSGMEKIALSRAKLKSDEEASKNHGEIQRLIASVLLKTPKRYDLGDGVPLLLDDSEELTDIVEGELTIGNTELRLEDFT
jgi:hypothetical protein